MAVIKDLIDNQLLVKLFVELIKQKGFFANQ